MLERLGRITGFTWFAVTAKLPWRLFCFLSPFGEVCELRIPGFLQGEFAAMDVQSTWRSYWSTRRISRGR